MKDIIIKSCIKNKNIDDAIQELNAKYSFYIAKYEDYQNIYNTIEKYYKGISYANKNKKIQY